VDELAFIRNQVVNERRHMAAVKNACAAAIEARPAHDALDAFCRSCCDYLIFIVNRFNAQDGMHCEQLRAHVPQSDVEEQRMLDDLESTLRLSAQALAELSAARQRRERGELDAESFLAACERYVRFFNSTLSKRRHGLTQLLERHYALPQWRRASMVDADSIVEERQGYAEVQARLPPGIELK
jgi:hypothetical protein